MGEEIKVLFIFEMLGRPAKHIKKTLEDFIENLGKQKGIKIENKKIHEPRKIENEKTENLFTTFAEVEVVCDNLDLVFSIVLNRFPSSVEILKPSNLNLTSFNLSQILSDLTIKLHRFDEVAKVLAIERGKFKEKVEELEKEIEKLRKK